MDIAAWSALLAEMRIDVAITPTQVAALDSYEQSIGLTLPVSYRTFCQVFGPGRLGGLYEFAAPGYNGRDPDRYELAARNSAIRAGNEDEWDEYADDPEQIRRAIIFGTDETAVMFFFDPATVTASAHAEYAVFVMWRDCSIERVCDTFAEFVMICLHRGSRTLYDEPPPLAYAGPWQGKPMWP